MFLLYAAPQVPMAHEFPQNISANSNFIENFLMKIFLKMNEKFRFRLHFRRLELNFRERDWTKIWKPY